MKAKEKTRPMRRPALTDALISKALNEAVRDAVEIHRRAGIPLAVWQDGKVALVSPDEATPKPRRPKRPRRKA